MKILGTHHPAQSRNEFYVNGMEHDCGTYKHRKQHGCAIALKLHIQARPQQLVLPATQTIVQHFNHELTVHLLSHSDIAED